MTMIRNHAQRIKGALRAVLPPSADVHFLREDESTIELKVAGRRVRARWVGAGWLRQIRAALAGQRRHPDVVVAHRMSPGAREALAREGIGWVDESGAAEISIGTVLVSRTGQAPEPAEKPMRWTPAVLAVAEALLCDTSATVAAATKATGLSSGSCTHALRVLTDLGLLIADVPRGKASARRIADADQLLEAYASAAIALAPRTSLVVGVTWRDSILGVAELGKKWNEIGIAWAATGTVAAAVLAPLLTTVASAVVYVDAHTTAELEAAALRVGTRPIEGGRLTLRPFPTETTRRFATTTDGLRVAPWSRVYADLRTIGVRGEEAAEHLREVMHGR